MRRASSDSHAPDRFDDHDSERDGSGYQKDFSKTFGNGGVEPEEDQNDK